MAAITSQVIKTTIKLRGVISIRQSCREINRVIPGPIIRNTAHVKTSPDRHGAGAVEIYERFCQARSLAGAELGGGDGVGGNLSRGDAVVRKAPGADAGDCAAAVDRDWHD